MKYNFSIVQQYETTLADSFVAKNKLRTPENTDKKRPSSGEARLYLGGINTEANKLFSFDSVITYRNKQYWQSNESCYFKTANLIDYMHLAKNEYLNPSQNYFYNIGANYYNILRELNSYTSEKLNFHVFYHPGEKDGMRFYINSSSPYWTLLRTLALPHITTIKINKIFNEDLNSIEYYFELNLDKNYSTGTDLPSRLENQRWLNPDFPTEKITLSLARRGQGLYKSLLLETMPKCCFTELSDVVLLRASHIKPWRLCTNNERLDPYNGLTLTPTYDVLFDKGLISFHDDGRLLLSHNLSPQIIETLSLKENEIYNIYNDTGKRSPYLKFHRTHIFKK